MRITEIESLDAFDRALEEGLSRLRGWHLQSVDLRGRAHELSRISVAGGVFLGCTFVAGDGAGSEADVRRRGGLVFPQVPDVPVDPYRAALYTPSELYAGLDEGYAATPDAAAYAWSRGPRTLDRTLAAALHDHAIDDALEEYLDGRTVVGVLGGHALRRDEEAYAAAARLGAELAQRFTVATGGGPGAMEAANLGAWSSGAGPAALDGALEVLAGAPTFTGEPSAAAISAWARAAFEVRERWPSTASSLGIPTWFYGHEPPNAFAEAIAKYFSNATREDVLLRACRGGLVFLPGAAGTVQEIFQAACANYYAGAGAVVPMVLVGRDYWTRQVPAWDLLVNLGVDRAFGARLTLVDHPEEVLGPLVEGGGDGR